VDRNEAAIPAIGEFADPRPPDPADFIDGGWRAVIVLVHVATGGLAGAASGSRRRAAAIGPLLHFACDVVPHEDIPSRTFETASGIAALLLLARRRGLDAATVGAAASAAPDLEHILPLPRPHGRALFPSHRWPSPVRLRGIPAGLQLAAAVAILARLCRVTAPRA
jgi:hypothetical protein